ncbi:choline kinase cytoplasm [Abortiporus biennis]|nr:choline kinase cytoplasm [Abortiporus biennis]
MSPTLGPDLPIVHPLGSRGRANTPRNTSLSRTTSTGEYTSPRSPTRSISSTSIQFEDGEIDVVRVEGLKHSAIRLEARRYKSLPFSEQLLNIIRSLHIPSWATSDVAASALNVFKVSGSLTNAVFFVSCPSLPVLPTVLLRIYGPSSGSLISRPRELHILHLLSSQYHIGPRVYGTFENGRIEEYFDSTALTAADLRDPKISSWIGARMAELHQVDVSAVEKSSSSDHIYEIGAKRNVKSWLVAAREVLALPSVSDSVRQAFDLDSFEKEWDMYVSWLDKQEKLEGASPVVFAHNDTQYGNLLKLTNSPAGKTEHRQIIVVDFEYASVNPAAFDIANHFHEWTANYHSTTPHILNPNRYPTLAQRRNFYNAYLKHVSPTTVEDPSDVQLSRLDQQVRLWSPASHGMWAIWGIVQAREDLEGKDAEPEFDYVGYARCRMDGFRRELRNLGAI